MTSVQAPPARFSLKDHLFNQDTVTTLAEQVGAAHPEFAADRFVVDVMAGLPERELKQRIVWIAQCLRRHLPEDYRRAVGVILNALPPELDPSLSDGDFGDFIHAPYAQFVADYGCTPTDLGFSLAALREITKRFSAEYAIREFLNTFPETTLSTLTQWTQDPNYHVRRLCSEGTRPSLPWGGKLRIPLSAPLPILEVLHADRTRYVTRSVANHLNDISKSDPDLALSTLTRWQAAGRQGSDELDYLTRHATRTLIKQGHPDALSLWGLSGQPPVEVVDLSLTPTVSIGGALEFSFDLVAVEAADVLVDYVLGFQGKGGGLTGRKVYKLKKLSLQAGERIRVTKRHPLRANMSTRQLHPGIHTLQLQINGVAHGEWEFVLDSAHEGMAPDQRQHHHPTVRVGGPTLRCVPAAGCCAARPV